MLETFCKVCKELDRDNLRSLVMICQPGIHFIDAAPELLGLANLKSFMAGLYWNVNSIHIDSSFRLQQNNNIALEWLVSLSHPRLIRRRTVCGSGISRLHVTVEDLADFHRDYFAAGAVLYEQLPLFGYIITILKRGLKRRKAEIHFRLRFT